MVLQVARAISATEQQRQSREGCVGHWVIGRSAGHPTDLPDMQHVQAFLCGLRPRALYIQSVLRPLVGPIAPSLDPHPGPLVTLVMANSTTAESRTVSDESQGRLQL